MYKPRPVYWTQPRCVLYVCVRACVCACVRVRACARVCARVRARVCMCPSTAAFSHRTSAYSETPHDSCHAHRHDKRDVLYHDLPKSASVFLFTWTRILMCAAVWRSLSNRHMALGSLSTFPDSSRKRNPVFGTFAPHNNPNLLSLSDTLMWLIAVCYR